MYVALLIAATAALLLVGTWLLYPLAAVLLARMRPRAARGTPGWEPRVTVILATREAAEVVSARVTDCLNADYPAEKLSVVVGLERGGATRPAEIDAPRVRAVEGDAPGGKACNLNAAVREAEGEILLFADSHQRFEPDTIRLLVEMLGDERFGAISGALVLPGETSGSLTLVERYWQMERLLREAEGVSGSTVGVTGAVYALRRELWEPLPAGLILDDLYVPMRVVLAGRRVGYHPEARAHDVRPARPDHEYGRKVRTLTGNFQLCAWLPSVLHPVKNPIWLRFVWHKLMRLLTPYLCVLLVGSLLLAAALWHPGVVLVAVALLAATVALVAWAPTSALVRLRQTVQWGMAMQAAALSATIRGLRGRWDVWQ